MCSNRSQSTGPKLWQNLAGHSRVGEGIPIIDVLITLSISLYILFWAEEGRKEGMVESRTYLTTRYKQIDNDRTLILAERSRGSKYLKTTIFLNCSFFMSWNFAVDFNAQCTKVWPCPPQHWRTSFFQACFCFLSSRLLSLLQCDIPWMAISHHLLYSSRIVPPLGILVPQSFQL